MTLIWRVFAQLLPKAHKKQREPHHRWWHVQYRKSINIILFFSQFSYWFVVSKLLFLIKMNLDCSKKKRVHIKEVNFLNINISFFFWKTFTTFTTALPGIKPPTYIFTKKLKWLAQISSLVVIFFLKWKLKRKIDEN